MSRILLLFLTVPVWCLAGNSYAQDGGIADIYPGDNGIGSDPRVLFHDDFESQDTAFSKWKVRECSSCLSYESDSSLVNNGSYSLKDTATKGKDYGGTVYRNLAGQDRIYVRYYVRFKADTQWPHHMGGISAVAPGYFPSAGYRPPGDKAFWSSLEPHRYNNGTGDQMAWAFYTYWQEMRSWANEDGSPSSTCLASGTCYYGNNFVPVQGDIQKDRWYCIEAMLKANTPNQHDGEQAMWVDGQMIGNYALNSVNGNWLRENFFTWGYWYGKITPIVPFEGYNWRSVSDLKINSVDLEWWFSKYDAAAPTENTAYFDDFVVATEHIGCIKRVLDSVPPDPPRGLRLK
ncbi:MAG: hypothetical protein HY400_04010 [Elusimicrobia bacterium]|nr:hypothetical protein [Elusimicrobiota bacterium]